MKKLALALAVSASTALAQENTESVGVTLGEAEGETNIGLYYAETKKDTIGWYIDISSNFNSGAGDDYGGRYTYYDYGLDAIVGDPETGKGVDVFSVHFGGTNSISENLFGYLGLGLYSSEEYTEYYDPYKILGDSGHYHVVEESDLTLSIAGGLLYNVDETVQFKVGADTGNASVNFGVGIRF